MATYGVFIKVKEVLGRRLRPRDRGKGLRREGVVATQGGGPVLDHQFFPGRKLSDPGVDRAGRGRVAVAEEFGRGLEIEAGLGGQRGEDRPDFRTEMQLPVLDRVIDWLDAELVAGEEQAAAARFPDGQAEHSLKAVEDLVAPFHEALDDDLRIAVTAEPVALGLELRAERAEIVDLAVEGDPDAAGGIGHRLVAGRAEVENREAPETEAERAVEVHAGIVGTAVDDGVHHPADAGFSDGLAAGVMEGSANAAHKAGRREGRDANGREGFWRGLSPAARAEGT